MGAGTFGAAAGSSACLNCSAHAHAPAGSTSPLSCRCNHAYTGPDGGSCQPCGAGTYKNLTGTAACTACPADSNAPAGSSSARACQCNAGFASSQNGSCVACEPGYFKPAGTDGSCLPCPHNSHAAAASAACACNAGWFDTRDASDDVSNASLVCSACAPGTFKSRRGSGLCVPCPSGSFVNVSNASGDSLPLSSLAAVHPHSETHSCACTLTR